MLRRRSLLTLGLVAAVAVSIGVALAAAGGPDGRAGPPKAQAGDVLPDLDLVEPQLLIVRSVTDAGKRRFLLSFRSAAENVGVGPITIEGSRAGLNKPRMSADQIVQREDGSTRRIAGVGQLEYVTDPTHEHWHLLTFMSYELRSAKGNRPVRPDEKTGFCLGDRYASARWAELPAHAPEGVYMTNCGLGDRSLLGLTEGISVGFGDNYDAWRDGQQIDVTGLPAGRYVLVHRVNADRALLESSFRNNASSAVLELRWPRGQAKAPRVRVLATCPGAATCRAR